MRIQSFFLFLLLLGAHNTAQELTGVDRVVPGTLASFEIVPAQEASWHMVSPASDVEAYQVDTGLSKLYFASPRQGRFTIIAGIVTEGKPRLLTKTFLNGTDDDFPLPVPVPIPPVSSLKSWIKAQIPVLVKSANVMSEIRLVAGCFEEMRDRIDEGTIKTAQNARSQLQIALTETLALASPTAVTDWTPFLTALSRQLESELGENIEDLAEVKKILQRVTHAMQSLELHTNVRSPLPNVDRPAHQAPNRTFRSIFSR